MRSTVVTEAINYDPESLGNVFVVMELINGEVGINIRVYVFSSKATYEFILPGPVERKALEAG